MFVPSQTVGVEYLATSFFSAVAAFFSWLARRSGKRNTKSLENEVKPSLAILESRTNGELIGKIREVIREEVTHDELVRSVSEEAVRDYLAGILAAHLASDDYPNEPGRSFISDIAGITERRRHGNDGE